MAVLPLSRVPNLADIGQGRIGRFGRVAILEQHDGTAWTAVGRYGSLRDANVALDANQDDRLGYHDEG